MVSEPKNTTGVTFQWERQAMNGEEMPNGLRYPDQILYLSLRMLYAQLKQGILDRQTAIKEKKKLLDEYRCYRYREQMGDEWVQIIKNTETARAEYRKNRTLDNADRLLVAVEGTDLKSAQWAMEDTP